jgi:hypothetical protein
MAGSRDGAGSPHDPTPDLPTPAFGWSRERFSESRPATCSPPAADDGTHPGGCRRNRLPLPVAAALLGHPRPQGMNAKIFLSCGQKDEEKELANRIAKRIEALRAPGQTGPDAGFHCYVAVADQSLEGLRENIFHQLETSEYFVFLDFKRDPLGNSGECRGSLFTNQELAVASFLSKPAILFQEEGVRKLDGMLASFQSNLITFRDRRGLEDLITGAVEEKLRSGEWSTTWKDQLVIEVPTARFSGTAEALPGSKPGLVHYYHLGVRNLHHTKVALNCCVLLESIQPRDWDGIVAPFDPVELKWAGTPVTLPNVIVPATTMRLFDCFKIRHDAPATVEFQTLTDSMEFSPVIRQPGIYDITYCVSSSNMQLARRTVRIQHTGEAHGAKVIE